MKNLRDGERAATAAAMVPPAEMPQMPLIGECCSIQRSTCRTLSLTAAARPASSSAESSCRPTLVARFDASPAPVPVNPHPK
eukprot:scaffold102890_cov72-Phaeocystis_antarctica.AAC.1